MSELEELTNQLNDLNIQKSEFGNTKEDRKSKAVLQIEINKLRYKISEIKQHKRENEKKKNKQERLNLSSSHEMLIKKYLEETQSTIYEIQSSKQIQFVIKENKIISKPLDSKKLVFTLKNRIKHKYDYNISLDDNEIIDILINNKLIREAFEIGYRPSLKQRTFIYENKLYLNKFEEGEHETKFKQIKIDDKLKDMSCEKLHAKVKDTFPLIDDLISHICGDIEPFYRYNMELFSSPDKYKNIINDDLNKLYFSNLYGDKSHEDMVFILQNKLNEITPEDKKKHLKHKLHFYKWFAHLLQNPLIKIPSGFGFKTVQGVGKDITKDWILSPIMGTQNVKAIGQEVLAEKHNGYMFGSRLIIANELEVSKKSIDMHQKLKEDMTNPTIGIRSMNKDLIMLENFAHFLFFGNHDNMLRVEKGDRRLTIYEQNYKVPELIPYKLSPTMNGIKILNTELINFIYFLKHIQVDLFDVKNPLMTDIKETMMLFSDNDVDDFVKHLKESFDCSLDCLVYYSRLDKKSYVNTYLHYDNKKLTYTFKDKTKKELISNDLLFFIFGLWREKYNISGHRPQKSFSILLNKLGYKQTEASHNTIDKIKCRYRYSKQFFNHNYEMVQK